MQLELHLPSSLDSSDGELVLKFLDLEHLMVAPGHRTVEWLGVGVGVEPGVLTQAHCL